MPLPDPGILVSGGDGRGVGELPGPQVELIAAKPGLGQTGKATGREYGTNKTGHAGIIGRASG
jgi:hypothetical protein